jgi:hypothetical protein
LTLISGIQFNKRGGIVFMNQNNKKAVVFLFTLLVLVQTIMFTAQSAPPSGPEQYQTTLESDTSVYVSESQPTYNFNSGTNRYYLDIYQDEFTYQWVSFVKFDLSSLPEDANVLDAEISLYLIADPDGGGIVKMYPIRQDWSENSVTWNTKPSYKDFSKTQGLISSLNILTGGWKEWDATSVVEDWLDGLRTNYGVAFETEDNLPRFRSDESSYKPRIWILYETESGEEPEDPPEEPPEDNTPCEISYTVTPENPQSGDEVTISATATDNIGLEYLTIKEGSIELCSSFAEDDSTTILICEHTEILYTPGKSFFIEANDLGSSSTQLITVDIDVAGSGSNPIVTIDIAFDDDDVTPSKYRLLPMDGQTVEITATASDPDGIDMMTITYDGNPYDYTYDPPETEVDETLYLINGADILEACSPPCTFRYSVRAYDTEGRSTRVEGEDIEVNAPWQWYWGLPFANWGCDENHTWSWTMMESIYGDEVWWNEERGWKMPHAEYIYDHGIRTGGRGGHCYGMCVTVLELSQPSPRIYGNLVQSSAVSIDDLERENWNNTWRYYYARQAGQYSRNIMALRVVQYLAQPEYFGSGLHPFIDDILDEIIDDLNAGNPGVLCIREGDSGHAVVPWRVKQVGSDRYHVYIYDPNHDYVSTHDSTDFENFEHYPFIDFGDSGWSRNGWWSYEWNSTSTWNGNIFYFSYDEVIGNPSSINYIGSLDPGTTPITDQRLPDPIQALAISSGDSTFYAVDTSGRKTGYVNGELVTEIPYSAPIYEFASDDGIVDMFMLPSNVTLTYHMESSIDSAGEMGEYSLMVWANMSCYFLENVSCTKDTKDELSLTPTSLQGTNPSHSVKFHRGDVTDIRANDPMDYSISLVNEFYNSPFVGRIYTFTSGQHEEGAEVELYISDDQDNLVVETFDIPFSFTVTTKSTESFDDDPDIDYIPESTGDFSMDANSKMVVSPENWKTTDISGSISTGNYQEQDDTDDDSTETPGFEIFFVIVSLLLIIFYKNRRA